MAELDDAGVIGRVPDAARPALVTGVIGSGVTPTRGLRW